MPLSWPELLTRASARRPAGLRHRSWDRRLPRSSADSRSIVARCGLRRRARLAGRRPPLRRRRGPPRRRGGRGRNASSAGCAGDRGARRPPRGAGARRAPGTVIPSRQLSLIGVTGTNGKTTTTGLVRHLLNATGNAGSIGTLGAFDGRGEAVPSTAGTLTTPGPIDLQATLGGAGGARRAPTSPWRRRRTASTRVGSTDSRFAAGVFTNLTRDHLDYHGTMEAYLAAKLKLSGLLATERCRGREPRRPGLARDLPAADAAGSPSAFIPRPTCGPPSVVLDAAGSRFRLDGRFGTAEVSLPLLGDFNVANALAAAACALGARACRWPRWRRGSPPRRRCRGGWSASATRRASCCATTPTRRMRWSGRSRRCGRSRRGRLIVVFGCGGDRDRGKRPIMGRHRGRSWSDLADRHLGQSAHRGPGRDHRRHRAGHGRRRRTCGSSTGARPSTRRWARRGRATRSSSPGKGHETYQVIGTEKLPFDEREIVRDAVHAVNAGGEAPTTPPWAEARRPRGAATAWRRGRQDIHRHLDRHRGPFQRARCSWRWRASGSTATTTSRPPRPPGAGGRGGARGDAAGRRASTLLRGGRHPARLRRARAGAADQVSRARSSPSPAPTARPARRRCWRRCCAPGTSPTPRGRTSTTWWGCRSPSSRRRRTPRRWSSRPAPTCRARSPRYREIIEPDDRRGHQRGRGTPRGLRLARGRRWTRSCR